jgi:DNA-binding transcriptional ArsR family regulator
VTARDHIGASSSGLTMPDIKVVKALGHPLRVRILQYLGDKETVSAAELSRAWNVDVGLLSYHVKRLQALGFLRLVARRPRRGAIEHFYAMTTDGTAQLADLLSPARRRATPADIGSALKRLRERHGRNCVQVARAVGLDVEEVVAIEDGRGDPRLRTLLDLTECLDASLADLLV